MLWIIREKILPTCTSVVTRFTLDSPESQRKFQVHKQKVSGSQMRTLTNLLPVLWFLCKAAKRSSYLTFNPFLSSEQGKNLVQNRRRPLGAWRWNFDVRCNCLGDRTRIHINVPAGKMRSPFTSTFTRARSFWSNQAGQALERMPKRREQGSREATP